MRRRAMFLRKARELAYRDLGGLVFTLHRFGQRNDALVLAKLRTLGRVDAELRALEDTLAERRPVTVLREAGITACPRCAAVHGSEDRYCPNCGLPMGRHADLPIAPVTAAAGGQSAPVSGTAQPPQATAPSAPSASTPGPAPASYPATAAPAQPAPSATPAPFAAPSPSPAAQQPPPAVRPAAATTAAAPSTAAPVPARPSGDQPMPVPARAPARSPEPPGPSAPASQPAPEPATPAAGAGAPPAAADTDTAGAGTEPQTEIIRPGASGS